MSEFIQKKGGPRWADVLGLDGAEGIDKDRTVLILGPDYCCLSYEHESANQETNDAMTDALNKRYEFAEGLNGPANIVDLLNALGITVSWGGELYHA